MSLWPLRNLRHGSLARVGAVAVAVASVQPPKGLPQNGSVWTSPSVAVAVAAVRRTHDDDVRNPGVGPFGRTGGRDAGTAGVFAAELSHGAGRPRGNADRRPVEDDAHDDPVLVLQLQGVIVEREDLHPRERCRVDVPYLHATERQAVNLENGHLPSRAVMLACPCGDACLPVR